MKRLVNKVRSTDTFAALLVVLASFGAIGTVIAAWVTHVLVCLSTGAWGFLVAGALVVPIAVIHGIGIWLGYFQ